MVKVRVILSDIGPNIQNVYEYNVNENATIRDIKNLLSKEPFLTGINAKTYYSLVDPVYFRKFNDSTQVKSLLFNNEHVLDLNIEYRPNYEYEYFSEDYSCQSWASWILIALVIICFIIFVYYRQSIIV